MGKERVKRGGRPVIFAFASLELHVCRSHEKSKQAWKERGSFELAALSLAQVQDSSLQDKA